MSVQDIASLGKMLGQFLALFADCFSSVKGQRLLAVYVRGLLSEIGRKNAEAIALNQNIAPRTLQRLLETIKWDQDEVLRRCRQIVAEKHANTDAIGVIDETGTAKSGSHTVGVKRQYNGNRGKIENAVVSVAASFATSTFQCLIAAQMYLPKEWAEDQSRRKKRMFQGTLNFLPKARSLCS
jgi:SRSO17 transposase